MAQPENGTGVSRLRVGVVGCGIMGRKHALNALAAGSVDLVAVADLDIALAQNLAADTGARAFGSAEEMLAVAGPFDALIVATPPAHRRALVASAAATGAALLLEKPIALSMDDVRSMTSDVSHAGVVNAVGFQLRYSPLMEEAKKLLDGRRVTQVRTLTTTSYYLKLDVPLWYLNRNSSGGPLLEQAIHMMDSARHLVGDVKRISARAARLKDDRAQGTDSEDTIVMAYEFANGALGTHTDSCATSEFNWEIELFGTDWRLLVDFARKRLRGYVDGVAIDTQMPDDDLHLKEMRAFLDATRRRDPAGVRSDFSDAGKTLTTVLSGRDSMDRDGEWLQVE